ncbi:MAG: response regulator [Gammaproteobacteria bacterium]|nr:response regulator [Gammaproteobacteria bacterium]MDE1983490.1 response regulator [Gammaproteobacteria bacterium]
MIRNWSIRNRVLLLALLPMVSLGVVLGGYFIRSRVHDLKASQAALGNTVAHQLASSSLYGMLTHNPQVLQALGQSVIQEQSIDSVAITDNAGQVLAQASTPAPRERGLVASIARQIGAETGFQGSLTFTQLIVWNNTDAATPGQTHGTTIGKVTVRLSEVHFADRQARIIVNGALIMLMCLALSILLALIISSSVVAPIGRVIAVVRRFSGGEHSARVPELSGGELGQLERGINHMAANAQRSQQELQDQVDQATTELRGTLEEFEIKSVELDLARKRALEASRVKTEFLANMSHEIRTPMNAVLGFSDLLTRTPLNDSQRNYLATIRQSAQILLMLLDNILLAAHLEMGESGVHASSISLRDLLEDVLQIHAMEAYAKRLELVLDTDGNETQALLADRAKLMRILGNLLANAIKFTPAGSIVIRARSTPRNAGNVQVDIEITDTGIGIREQDQRRLFEAFFQVDAASDRQQGGAGLGLYIAKKLVEQMGGSLTIASAFGQGSKFHLRLNLPQDASAPARTLAAAAPKPRNNSLLVYESNPQAAAALQARLERLGWKPQLVANLAQFKEQLQTPSAYAAIVLSLSYGELQQPAELASLLSATAAGLPALALVNSVNAELHADIGRRIGSVCLPKSLGESALDRQLLRLITGADTPADAQEPGSLQSLQGLSILVADDNRINRLLERILLEKHGARVLEAKSGQELLKLVTEHAVDLILLDMHMPDQDGWQVAQRLRSELRLAIPVIALSAAQSDKSAQALAEAGLSGWLMKPLDEAALTAIIGRLLPASRLSAVTLTTAPSAAPEEALAGLRPALRQMLAEDLPAQWQAVEQAWQQHDLGQLQEQVHKLNGTAAFCRLLNLRSLCAQLETLLRDPRDSALAPLLASIGAEVARLMQYLERPEVSSALPP